MTVEQNVLTVRAERAPAWADSAKRPYAIYNRQFFLGEALDAGKIAANYAEACSS